MLVDTGAVRQDDDHRPVDVRQDRIELRLRRCIDNQRAASGAVQHPGGARGGQRPVQRHVSATCQQRPENRHVPGRRTMREDAGQPAVVVRQPASQSRRQRRRPLPELSVGEGAALDQERRLVRRCVSRTKEQLLEGRSGRRRRRLQGRRARHASPP